MALLAFGLAFNVFAGETVVKKEPINPTKIITFDGDNFFPITEEFSETLMENFVEKLMIHEDKELILYFDSPGGSVFSLARMVAAMKSSKLKFICVARFAASAAFSLFQYCNERYVLNDGIIMQHNWSGGFQDEAPRILSLFNAVDKLVKEIDEPVIKKLGLTSEEFYKKINNNWWMSGKDAVNQNAADAVALNVTCSKDTIRKKIIKSKTSYSFFGSSSEKVKVSLCPLLNKEYPLPKNNNSNDEL